MSQFVPADFQPGLPLDRLILSEPPEAECIEMDVLFVGGGPAGLAGAIELAKLVKADNGEISIGVLEKASALGEHTNRLIGQAVHQVQVNVVKSGLPGGLER